MVNNIINRICSTVGRPGGDGDVTLTVDCSSGRVEWSTHDVVTVITVESRCGNDNDVCMKNTMNAHWHTKLTS